MHYCCSIVLPKFIGNVSTTDLTTPWTQSGQSEMTDVRLCHAEPTIHCISAVSKTSIDL